MKRILLASILFSVIAVCKAQTLNHSVWTIEYERKITNELNSSIKEGLPDSIKRADLVLYIVSQLKLRLPEGIESVSRDSVNKLSTIIGKKYAYRSLKGGQATGLVPTYINWTPQIEAILREAILKDWPKDDLKNGNKFCDCIIEKLKVYPDKILMPPPHDVAVKVVGECKKEKLSAHAD